MPIYKFTCKCGNIVKNKADKNSFCKKCGTSVTFQVDKDQLRALKNALRERKKFRRDTQTQVIPNKKKYNRKKNKKIIKKKLDEYYREEKDELY